MASPLFRGWNLAYFVILLFYIIAIVPAPGISLPGSPHDDGLFMKWSNSILDGQWLGSWDILSTSKGPLHSVLTAVAARIGINPFAYKRIFYLVGSLVFVGTALNKAPNWLRVVTLITLLLDPFQFGNMGLRNLREGTYIPLQIIAFGLGTWSLDQLRKQIKFKVSLVMGLLGTATCFGLILITREGRMVAWVELAAWLILGGLVFAWRHRQQLHHRLGIKLLAALLVVLGIVAWTKLPVLAISGLNGFHYRSFISNSTEEGEFPSLYGRLLGISVSGEAALARVPVRQTTLGAIIQESDSGSHLSRILNNIPSHWRIHGCSIYPETCGEIGGGWFMWALRDAIGAVLEPGASEASFQRVVQSANSELDSICKQSSMLLCSSPQVGYKPSMSRWGFRSLINEVAKEGSRIASLVLIPAVYPHGKVTLAIEQVGGLHETLARPLGIRKVSLTESFKWHRILRAASILGAAGKWLMIVLAVISVGLATMRSRLSELWDPVCVWMLLCLGLQLATYTLLGLTSFPGDAYVTMASPLFIGLLARLSAYYMPLGHSRQFRSNLPKVS
ncbi:hypothetical protein [Synechococcus sp. BA-132 BA5]|uniref:hypothetical protein n=1 Tax=Synechococcus sp. BA-132 BA5 TaxID=3110252 RepID=UPI002B206182|nr:hypothetical protein [Synechococcus sp. BA-132 BA5]MEA5414420.1 hypothetical protein [Synechococcus sp. BA-132 BA5]